ncbi:AAA family ATPase [Candidatus Bathyarchaeota archaeon]|nr:AAA family ATPase [Candidatus Bathyarchaeota archaeon]
MQRVTSGVKGLDEMLGGGFPQGRVILISGGPGAGKTNLSLQFIASAADEGDPGVYVTLEEPLELIRQNIDGFDWKIIEKEVKNKIRLLDFYSVSFLFTAYELRDRRDRDSVTSILEGIEKAVKNIEAKNIVIDPITTLTLQEMRAGAKRRMIADLFTSLRRIGCTTVITSEMSSSRDFMVEEFLADGVIRLTKHIENFQMVSVLRIEKMRGIKYDDQPRRYAITSRGFTVFQAEPVLI